MLVWISTWNPEGKQWPDRERVDPKVAAELLVADMERALERTMTGDDIRLVMEDMDKLRSELAVLANQADLPKPPASTEPTARGGPP